MDFLQPLIVGTRFVINIGKGAVDSSSADFEDRQL